MTDRSRLAVSARQRGLEGGGGLHKQWRKRHHNRLEDRPGWRALLEPGHSFDAVLVWKIDRLARRVVDFLQAFEALTGHGAGTVAVEDTVDMTTAQGRAFATLRAVFEEMEAETIRSRVKAARTHLLRNGRAVGGTVPYGGGQNRPPTVDDAWLIVHVVGALIAHLAGAARK